MTEHIKINDTVICHIDEYHDGNPEWFEGTVISKNAKGVEVVYLSGYRNRGEFVEWKDICAVVYMTKPWISIPEVPFRGNFKLFKKGSKDADS